MPPHHFTTADGLSLAYRDEGGGPPLLCLAGLTRNMADFDTIAETCKGTARVIRMDYRGRGASDHAKDWHSYTIPQEAQDALALLDHLGLDRAAILGTSRGGLIAMTIAALAPDRLTGAMLVDIGPQLDASGLTHIMGHLGTRPALATYAEAARALATTPGFANVNPAQWRAHAEKLWVEAPDGLDIRYDPRLRDAVIETSATGDAPDLWPLFDALAGKPTGLIRGANSDLLTPETAAEMRRRRPDLIFAEVPDRGHVPFLDEPQSRAAIDSFIAALPR